MATLNATAIYEKLDHLERELQRLKIQTYKLLPPRINPATGSGVDLKAWKAAAGILKGRRIPDPVAWQRKIRKEWERKLP